MPPCGFRKRGVDALIEFGEDSLRLLQLEIEAGKHSTIETGLEHEIAQMERVLAGDTGQSESFCLEATFGALIFTLRFYKDLLRKLRASTSTRFEDMADAYILELKDELEKLHIDEDGNLVERPT
ncbi:MAG: hypothetical protein V4480_01920 [Patescibacteria group bacterium]